MTCQCPDLFNIENSFQSSNAGVSARRRRSLANILLWVSIVFSVSLALGAFRQPVATPLDPLAGIQMQREALAGTDALLDRGVIPPHRPDWIVMDCLDGSSQTNAYARFRQTVCEATKSFQARN
jgi:hypothetical protein